MKAFLEIVKHFRLPKMTSETIMYGIAVANALRLGWAYSYADADGDIRSLPGLFGIILGMFVSIGTAFVAGRIPSIKIKSRYVLAWTGLVFLLILEPLILAPLTFTDMPEKLLANIPGAWGWGWSIVLALVPSIVMVSIAFAGGSLVSASQPATASTTPTEKPVKVEKKPAFFCKVGGCSGSPKTVGGSFPTQAALNAHMIKHKPKVIGYKASFEPVIAEGSGK